MGFHVGDWHFFAGCFGDLDVLDCWGLNDEDLLTMIVHSFPVVLGIWCRRSVADRLVITLVGSPF